MSKLKAAIYESRPSLKPLRSAGEFSYQKPLPRSADSCGIRGRGSHPRPIFSRKFSRRLQRRDNLPFIFSYLPGSRFTLFAARS